MRAPRWIDDQGSGYVRASFIYLRSMKDEDVFVALVLMARNDGPRRIAQQRRRGATLRVAFPVAVQAMNVHTRTKRRPFEACIEDALAQLGKDERVSFHHEVRKASIKVVESATAPNTPFCMVTIFSAAA